jgi:hypothetical protein
MDKPIPLAASEIRLLKAARKLIEGGEPLIKPYIELEAHDISLSTALDACEKYFHGSKVAFRIAKDRVYRRLREANGSHAFWSASYLREIGYTHWREEKLGGGFVKILPGNITKETFNNWKVLANLAYIDKILETGEIK